MVAVIMTVVIEMETVFIMGTDDGSQRMIIAFIPIEMLPSQAYVFGALVLVDGTILGGSGNFSR